VLPADYPKNAGAKETMSPALDIFGCLSEIREKISQDELIDAGLVTTLLADGSRALAPAATGNDFGTFSSEAI